MRIVGLENHVLAQAPRYTGNGEMDYIVGGYDESNLSHRGLKLLTCKNEEEEKSIKQKTLFSFDECAYCSVQENNLKKHS